MTDIAKKNESSVSPVNPAVLILCGVFFGLWIGRADFMLAHTQGMTFKNLSLVVVLAVLAAQGGRLREKAPRLFGWLTALTVCCAIIRAVNMLIENIFIYSILQESLNWFLALLVVYLLLKLNFSCELLALMMKYLIITFAACTVFWFLTLPNFGFNEVKRRFYPCTIDPNEFCMYASFSLFTGLWALRRLKARNTLLVASLLVIGAFSLITVSRSGYAGLVLALLLSRMFTSHGRCHSRLVFTIMLAVVAMITAYIFTKELGYADMFNRLDFEDIGNDTEFRHYSSGRLEIWKSYAEAIPASPWLGYLTPEYVTNTPLPADYETEIIYKPHNIVLTYMVFYGIPLTVLAIAVIFAIGLRYFQFNRRHPEFEAYLPACGYVGFVATSMTLSHDITLLLTLSVLIVGKLRQQAATAEAPPRTPTPATDRS